MQEKDILNQLFTKVNKMKEKIMDKKKPEKKKKKTKKKKVY